MRFFSEKTVLSTKIILKNIFFIGPISKVDKKKIEKAPLMSSERGSLSVATRIVTASNAPFANCNGEFQGFLRTFEIALFINLQAIWLQKY